MNREAINYVKEAEARVNELRANAEIEIKEIEKKKEQEINTHKDFTEQEIANYQKEKYDNLEQVLSKDEIVIDATVQEETVKFDAAYKGKKDLLANRIAEEVLRKYGNS
ncbi:hypothetical protein [Alkalibacterium sp. 20]|uniref:hypothetical protein n=1 Tax=Alkalibacterium sp. 20 TaxID=1798803 RepID=UPI0008FFE059|nr:hypothetical protein [Alkalibacterium sp. 20]OJF89746.1 hypothetical protein AX762_04990 [Alkalibacterium sp. 20]